MMMMMIKVTASGLMSSLQAKSLSGGEGAFCGTK
jgi:hypothetical protein